MPDYAWTCHACGATNLRDAHACVSCKCPAAANSATIASHRSAFLAAGGTLQHPILEPVDAELGAFDVLVRPILFLLSGWWGPRLWGLRSGRR